MSVSVVGGARENLDLKACTGSNPVRTTIFDLINFCKFDIFII